MKQELFYNGIFHPMTEEGKTFSAMTVCSGRISGTFEEKPEGSYFRETDLKGAHVYPCLIDGHVHMLYTIAVLAKGFDVCSVTAEGVKPDRLEEIGSKIREYCRGRGRNEIIAANSYVLSAVTEKRMPTKGELDEWAGGRPIVVYNIDGHSTALSTAMLKLIGINPEGHSGILTGEENDRNQGKITDLIGAQMGLSSLAKGIAALHNSCAEFGIGMIGALEGNGDSPKDASTKLIFRLARHFGLPVRFYLQYMDIERVLPFEKHLKHRRMGGCGDWEMDGAVGAHSAAFFSPYKDSGEKASCYYEPEFVKKKVSEANKRGFQVSSHAIGEAAIDMLLEAFNAQDGSVFNRIEHMEFINEAQLQKLEGSKYAVFMQPGYAWIDKRYLHSYESFLPEKIEGNLKLKSIIERGMTVCASTDSPVQALDPYLQMLGMVDFYNSEESVSNYRAFEAYTLNPAKAMNELEERGTLEEGKAADFFVAEEDFFSLPPAKIPSFRPVRTYYGGKPYKKKKGSMFELLIMLIRRGHSV